MIVFAGLGNGSFAAAVRFGLTAVPTAVSAADFNGDGTYDLVAGGTLPAVATNAAPSVAVVDANGDGRSSAADLIAITMTITNVQAVPIERAGSRALDVDGDGVVNRQDARTTARRLFG